jgi:hypothetical protein
LREPIGESFWNIISASPQSQILHCKAPSKERMPCLLRFRACRRSCSPCSANSSSHPVMSIFSEWPTLLAVMSPWLHNAFRWRTQRYSVAAPFMHCQSGEILARLWRLPNTSCVFKAETLPRVRERPDRGLRPSTFATLQRETDLRLGSIRSNRVDLFVRFFWQGKVES